MGVSGRRMLEAMIAGETDAEKIAEPALGQLKKKRDPLIEALRGRVREHRRTMLRLELAPWKFLDALVAELEVAIEEALRPFQEAARGVQTIPGFSEVSASATVAEIGARMEQFADAEHLASWAVSCPGNHESAGKHYSGKTRGGNLWLKRVLCQVAWAASHTRNTPGFAGWRPSAARSGRF